jgi:hypothetical protein
MELKSVGSVTRRRELLILAIALEKHKGKGLFRGDSG